MENYVAVQNLELDIILLLCHMQGAVNISKHIDFLVQITSVYQI